MYIQKVSKKQAVKASTRRVARKAIKADDEIIEDEIAEEGEIEVAPEAAEILFEAEDVAELVAEVTGQDVAVDVDDEAVTFTVGEDEFKVEPDGDEEILEATRRPLQNKKTVKASTRRPARRSVRR